MEILKTWIAKCVDILKLRYLLVWMDSNEEQLLMFYKTNTNDSKFKILSEDAYCLLDSERDYFSVL